MKLAGALFMMTFLPLAVGQEQVESAPPQQEEATTPSPIDSFFQHLLAQAQQVDELLTQVADKESADRIAGPLVEQLQTIDDGLGKLQNFPFTQEKDAEAMKMHMATLTHISQNTLATMQRLVEVNAYGSEALMKVFDHYKLSSEKIPHLQADDLPHAQLYSELAEMLDDALVLLRRTQDEASVPPCLESLRPLLKKIADAHHMLVQLAPPRTNEQKEAIRPARERLLKVSNELRKEISRLQAVHCFRNNELDALLPQLLQASS